MIHSVTITNYIGDSITMELKSPEKSGLNIYNIEGLGPGNADINTIDIVTADGALYNSARMNVRNIVMYIRFMPNLTIEETRLLTYKYFPIKKRLRFYIETDNRKAEIYGYVESNVPVIFERQEYTQISIICPDPYFRSAGEDGKTFFDFYRVEPMFEFPFSNESLEEPLLEFGNILSVTQATIYYNGDIETGFIMYIDAAGPITNPIISNIDSGATMKINIEMVRGDRLIISTIKGDKYIYLLREGITTNVLNAIDKNSGWFQLRHGDNLFGYTADSGVNNLRLRIETQILYEGV